MALLDVFIGSMQSKYAAMAILATLLAVALIVIFGKEKIGFGQKLIVVALMFLLSLPSMLYVLFQITCLVTGTSKGAWWCGVYAWILSGLIIVYSSLIIIMAVLSLAANAEAEKIEKFYAEKDATSEEAKKLLEGEVPSRDVVDQSAIIAPGEPTAVSPSEESSQGPTLDMSGPTMSSPENKVEPTVVNATVEKFTSCGAAWKY